MKKTETKSRNAKTPARRGRGRPRLGAADPVDVRIVLLPDLLARIDRAAGGNRSAWIREAIEQRLAREAAK